jgi:hypothetical protein
VGCGGVNDMTSRGESGVTWGESGVEWGETGGGGGGWKLPALP